MHTRITAILLRFRQKATLNFRSLIRGAESRSEIVATFLAVCKVLNITNIYEEYFGANPADPLSSLNDEGKEKVLDYIGLLHDSGKYEKQTAKIIPCLLYTSPSPRD